MKYRVLAFMGILALTAGTLLQAQDYDDIYYDASKSTSGTVKTSAKKPTKTVAVYGTVPEQYKVAAQDNYRLERDVDEYNRRGNFEPEYEVDINGDTIYEDAFANTRRIERFYNPDVVILSDDDDLVELYYDESPTINLVVGSDWGYPSYGWASTYYPWYTGWYSPWYVGWGSPWRYSWYSPWYYGYGWHYGYYHGYYPWYASTYYWNHWGWSHHGWYGHGDWGRPLRPGYDRSTRGGWSHHHGTRSGLASNRNSRGRVGLDRPSSMPSRNGGRNGGIGTTSRNRSGYATSRSASGNMGSRNSSGVTSRSSVSRSSSYGSRSYSGTSGNRSYSSGSRSSSSSRSSGGSYSGGSSRSMGGGSYSGGGGGGSRGSSGGGGRRR